MSGTTDSKGNAMANRTAAELLARAEKAPFDYCFPNKTEDIGVLRFAIESGCHAKAPYYLGNLFYDKLNWQEAIRLWELSEPVTGLL